MKEIKLPEFKCLRCDHPWNPRLAALPAVCPRCKSPYWNKPRSKKAGPVAKKTG